MEYKRIHDLLQRYEHLTPPDYTQRKAVGECIHTVCGVEIPIDAISIQKHTALIRAEAITKNYIHMRKKAILTELEKAVGKGYITDLR